MSRISQIDDELQIFQCFSKHYPGGLIDIQHRDPPEPDIRAKNHSGKPIAFELVEFIDRFGLKLFAHPLEMEGGAECIFEF